jgi:hypothetical protein
MAFYFMNRLYWSLAASFLTGVALLLLSGVAADPRWWVKLLLVGCLALLGELAYVAWRQVLRPRPLLRIDQRGLECAYGRVAWSDIQAMTVEERAGGESAYNCLLVALRTGSTPLPPERAYFLPERWRPNHWAILARHRESSASERSALEVNIGWKSKQVLDAAHAYGYREP